MSLSDKHLYQFGEYRVDTAEKLLTCGESQVSVPPKVFEMLVLFLEHHGRLITKEELMETLWAGSFVEESNLTYTIRQLRKALGDDAKNPEFIETVSGSGYRFIAEVNEVPQANPGNDTPANENVTQQPQKWFVAKYRLPLFAAILLLVTSIVVAAWYKHRQSSQTISSFLSDSMLSRTVTQSGMADHAVISPDGKFVIYTSIVNGKTSVWRLDLGSSDNVQILPPAADFFSIPVISHDNQFVYLSRNPGIKRRELDIYRLPVGGGVPVKVIDQAQGTFSLSPDDKQISFIRCPFRKEDFCSLYVADSDGKNERLLVTNPDPYYITDNQFSPDGKTIAFGHGQSFDNSQEFSLSEYRLEDGAVIPILENQFFRIANIKWLPDGQNLLLTGRRKSTDRSRIWMVDRFGNIEQVTKDPSDYLSFSVSADTSKILATKVTNNYKLYISSIEHPENATPYVDSLGGATFTTDGKILYGPNSAADRNIWEMSLDGSHQRQLTNNGGANLNPLPSRDGRYILYTSNLSGSNRVWRMNADGSEQVQLTKENDGIPLSVSTDGNTVFFRSNLRSNLWQVPIEGGEESLVLDKSSSYFAISPDGKKTALYESDKLRIYSLETKQLEKEYPLDKSGLVDDGMIAWSHDGKFVVYVNGKRNGNTFIYLQYLDRQTPVRIADLGDNDVNTISLSPDDKQIVYTSGCWQHESSLITAK